MKPPLRFFSRRSREPDLAAGQQAFENGDYAKAAKEFLPLAESGNVVAQFNLGVMCQDGRGVPPDDKEAVRWLHLAAEQGYANAQFNLGVMYDQAKGVDQDCKEAMRWYRLAADQGNAEAQFRLGFLYEQGKGVEQDFKEAMRWYRFAADQGHAHAQLNLGFLYGAGEAAKGNSLMGNLTQAHFWFSLVAASGSANGTKNRDLVAREMTPDAITEALRLAQEWKPKTALPKELDDYKQKISECLRTFREGPETVSMPDAFRLLQHIEELMDTGSVLGVNAADLVCVEASDGQEISIPIVKTLQGVLASLVGEMQQRSDPEMREKLDRYLALRPLVRALAAASLKETQGNRPPNNTS